MQYLLLMYADDKQAPKTPEAFREAGKAWYAFDQEINAAGVVLSHTGLSPVADATTVRVRDGKTLTTDGPFAETHEQLGGYYFLECKDLDEAVAWAAKIPSAQYGSIEIRPVWGQNQ